jgi:Mg2+/Co2+ transporter CorB
MERIFVGIAALVFGPVLIGAFANAVWPGFVSLLQFIFWFIVAVGAAITIWALTRLLLIKTAEENAQRELEEEEQRTLLQRRQELEALYTRVRNVYHDIFDFERQKSQRHIGQ